MSDPMNAPVMYEMTSEQYAEQIRAAEKRGAVKALRAEAERLHEACLGGGGTVAHALFDLARRIEAGEVTL